MPKHAPPFAYLLAAYAGAQKTPGEKLAGRLLGKQDWIRPGTIVFPALVMTLFEADALRAAGTGHAAAASEVAMPTTSYSNEWFTASNGVKNGSGDVCSSISNWASSALNSVFNALTVGPSSNSALNFIGGLWNSAVALAR